MIITTHKQFPNYKRYEIEYEGRPLVMETGKLAELCNSAVLVSYGETTVLVTCTASARPKDGVDYFPLSVDFNEKLYAVGRIPGSFMRREGKPSLPAVLASRLIDRPMRPLFPSDLRNDVIIACEVLSVDRDCSPEITAMIGASAAVSISDVPFNGPIAGIVLGWDGEKYLFNPTQEQRKTNRMTTTIAATHNTHSSTLPQNARRRWRRLIATTSSRKRLPTYRDDGRARSIQNARYANDAAATTSSNTRTDSMTHSPNQPADT